MYSLVNHTPLPPGHEPPLTEWEYIPHIGPRPQKSFVGLKNAGATCYMNSVLQQLYMIPPVRSSILSVDDSAKELLEQQEEEEKKEGGGGGGKNSVSVSCVVVCVCVCVCVCVNIIGGIRKCSTVTLLCIHCKRVC